MKKQIKIIPYSKIFSYKNLYQEKKSVLIGGCFDLLHYGHLQFLKKAKEIGEFLIVALESDDFIRKYKKREPIHTQDERAEILASLVMVDLVIKLPLFSKDDDYFQMVKNIHPKIIAATAGDPQLENKKKQIENLGGQLKIVIDLLKRFSTRKILIDFNL
ncbi:MAG: adenylyltransferase/cytidyltransferase family protein [Microgenomates group bacterium]